MKTFARVSRWLPAGACGLILALALPARAAEVGAVAQVAAAPALTAEAIGRRIEELGALEGLDEESRKRAVAAYEKAIEHLIAAERWKAEAAEFERLQAEAPALLERVRSESTAETKAPAVAENADLASLEQELAKVEAELSAARKLQDELEQERKHRSERRVEVPRKLAEVTQALQTLAQRFPDDAPAPSSEPALAEWVLSEARKRALAAEADAYQKEIFSYDARRELLAARVDQAARTVASLEARADEIRAAVAERRRVEAERSAREAISATEKVAGEHPLLVRLAAENAELATLRSGPEGLAERIAAAKKELAAAADTLARLSDRFEGVRRRAEAVGFTEAIGLLLRKQRAELPDIRERQLHIRLRQGEIGRAQLRLVELEEQRTALFDPVARAEELVATADPPPASEEERRHLVEAVSELLEAKRNYISDLIADYDAYFVTLVDLDAKERELIERAQGYRAFIDEHVLWIRSGAVLGVATFRDLWPALVWIVSPRNLGELGEAVAVAIAVRPVGVGFVLIVWLCLFAYRGRLRQWLALRCERDRTRRDRTIVSTCASLAAAVLLAAPWPLLMLVAGWLPVAAEGAGGAYAGAVASGLARTGLSYLGIEIVRQLCRKDGPGVVYLGWSERATATLRRSLASLATLLLPAMFIVATLDAQSNEAWKNGLGRIAFVFSLIVLGAFARRLAGPSAGVLEGLGIRSRARWFQRLRGALPTLVVVPLALLAVFAAAGYGFAAVHLARKLEATVWAGLSLLIVDTLSLRWMIAARRQLAIRQAREARAAAAAKQAEGGTAAPEAAPVEEPAVDISAVNAQTRRLMRSFIVLGAGLWLWMIWSDVLPALRVFDRVELWTVSREVSEKVTSNGTVSYRTVTSNVPITLADLLEALIILVMTVVAGRNLPGFLEFTVLQRLPLDAGVRYALTSVSRYLISVIGGVLAFAAVGVSWAQVQWLVAAMTVGLGFGLQEIFANFVSGLIILLERPIRVGDTVTLGDVHGTVARIRIRATTIVDWDRKELIVPNKEFITGQLVNWTLSDQLLRVVVPVGIAYGSDTKLAERTLLDVARESSYVVDEPAPTVVFQNFGDSSLEFELRAYIASFDDYWHARHELRMRIDEAFRAAGIEIAFPQRDLHLRSVSGPIPVAVRE